MRIDTDRKQSTQGREVGSECRRGGWTVNKLGAKPRIAVTPIRHTFQLHFNNYVHNSIEKFLECGKPNSNTSEARGALAMLGEWPWHVAVYDVTPSSPSRLICGGTIVSPLMIISGKTHYLANVLHTEVCLNFVFFERRIFNYHEILCSSCSLLLQRNSKTKTRSCQLRSYHWKNYERLP